MKAKVGDRIVITDGYNTDLEEYTGARATVIDRDVDLVWVKAQDVSPTDRGNYYIYDNCYVLEQIYDSPLWKALK